LRSEHEDPMANGKPRRRSIFSGLLLILIGGLFLWNNLVGELGIWQLFTRWWPALLILWGLAKLYDHLAAQRTGQAAPSTITGGDIALVLLVVGLAGAAQGVSVIRHHDPGDFGWPPWEQPYSFSEELPAKAIPPGSRITIRTERGDISVRPENTPEIRALVKKTLGGSDERDAENRTRQVNVAIAEANGGYEVRTQNQGGQVRVDLEVHVPKQSNLVAQTARGGLQIAGLAGSVIAEAQRGNVEIRDTGGDVSAQMERGDVHIVGAQGNVKLSGRGGQVEIADVKGDATLEGEFFGPIRIEKVAKGARFVSRRTDLTISQLPGRLETGSGRLEIADAPGNLSLTTSKYDVVLENVGGRIRIENREGDVEIRFRQPPREDVEVTNRSGNIELVLPPKSSFEVHAESHSGDIDSDFEELPKKEVEGHGNTKLEGKLGTKGPQLRLKTTYGTIRLHKGQ